MNIRVHSGPFVVLNQSFFRRHDNTAHDDILAEQEYQKRRDCRDDQRRVHDGLPALLLQFIQPYHHRPHPSILANDECKHEIRICRRKCVQCNDGQNRFGKPHRDLPEKHPFVRTVQLRTFIQLLRQRIKEAFQQENRIAIRHTGQNQRRERIQ